MKRTAVYLMIILGLVICDQGSKALVHRSVPYGSHVTVFKGFFNISHVHNRGAVFGIFNQSGNSLIFFILTLASLLAFAVVVYFFIKVPASEVLLKFSLSLIIAGALGNSIDRLTRGYVIDFLDFHVYQWHWPSFNVADSCITIGALLMVYIILFRRDSQCSLCS
ncbi:MAG: signal peptidase II [Candidatus Aminicenantes bacterium]|nr:signal peptidase II [Candidatus Aminicenantes bacterium]